MATSYLVLLRCGHWFRESRPSSFPPPESGEMRVCADLRHYPEEYLAFYFATDPKIVREWFGMPPDYRPGHWRDMFGEWLARQDLSAEKRDELAPLLAECWKAALRSTERTRRI